MANHKDLELMRAQKAVLNAMHASQKAHRQARREQTILELMDGNKLLRTVGLITILVIVSFVLVSIGGGGGGSRMIDVLGY